MALGVLGSQNDLLNGALHNPDAYRELCLIEATTGYSFRKGYWISDLHPELLPDSTLAAVARHKASSLPASDKKGMTLLAYEIATEINMRGNDPAWIDRLHVCRDYSEREVRDEIINMVLNGFMLRRGDGRVNLTTAGVRAMNAFTSGCGPAVAQEEPQEEQDIQLCLF